MPMPRAGEWEITGPAPELAPGEFEEIRRMAHRAFGLDLKPGKEQLVAARLGRMMRGGRHRSYRELCRSILDDRTGESLAALIDALATNHTNFLREPDHFAFLRDTIAPTLRYRRPLEIWCAACSTGEEVWTLACTLNDALPGTQPRVVATDISRKALAFAQRASYPAARCEPLPGLWLSRYFAETPSGEFTVRPAVRQQASFSRLNLMEPLNWGRKFPVIFCRNVMIYFDAAVQQAVTERLAGALEPGGYLFVGHAESLTRFSHSLEYVRPAVYRKTAKREGAWTKS
jgi:chemotaxis protein methyltransferase CheR